MRLRSSLRRIVLLILLAFLVLEVGYTMHPKQTEGHSAKASAPLTIQLSQATYAPGDPVHITVLCNDPHRLSVADALEVQIFRLTEQVAHFRLPIQPSERTWQVQWLPPDEPAAYGVRVSVQQTGSPLAVAESAFDVTADWTTQPRYGFVSEFGDLDEQAESQSFAKMNRLHLNALQFYDWLYRHEQPVPPTEVFTDSLGRRLQVTSIETKISLSRSYNMAPMAYVAIYAASPQFFSEHKAWAMYDRDGKPIDFGDGYLYLMDPSRGSGWSEHLIDEFTKVVERFDFDGVHIDQYGYPKVAYDAAGRTLIVGPAFRTFLDDTKAALVQASPDRNRVAFNSVTNWPAALVAQSAYDFNYIEVWEPYTTYGDLEFIIQGAHAVSGGKATVIAAYPDTAHEPTVRLVDAFIFAHGATHIELGEGDGMLVDPYFPNFQRVSGPLWEALVRYYDFIVWYKEWLYGARQSLAASSHVLLDGEAAAPRPVPGRVHAIAYRSDKAPRTVVSLINLTGTNTVEWKAQQPAPVPVRALDVTVTVDHKPSEVWVASPDGPSVAPKRVPFMVVKTPDGYAVQFRVDVDYWTVVALEGASDEGVMPKE